MTVCDEVDRSRYIELGNRNTFDENISRLIGAISDALTHIRALTVSFGEEISRIKSYATPKTIDSLWKTRCNMKVNLCGRGRQKKNRRDEESVICKDEMAKSSKAAKQAWDELGKALLEAAHRTMPVFSLDWQDLKAVKNKSLIKRTSTALEKMGGQCYALLKAARKKYEWVQPLCKESEILDQVLGPWKKTFGYCEWNGEDG